MYKRLKNNFLINTVMNYQAHYDTLVQRSIVRELSGYTEQHHIIPKCMGGTNDINNLVRLTPEEHYVAHQLLVKIYPGNYKLLQAILRMSGPGNSTRKCTNKLFGWLKRKINNERVTTLETRKKMSIAAQNQSDEKKKQISDKLKGRVSPNKGKKLTEEQKAKRKELRNNIKRIGPNLGKTFSDETKQKMSNAKLGIPKSDEHRANMSIAHKRKI